VGMSTAVVIGVDRERMNVNGGACALGIRSPPRARGSSSPCCTRCNRNGVERGIASLCIGGGEATVVAIERSAA
jgi:acetyl-CoA C-acetyltransferase